MLGWQKRQRAERSGPKFEQHITLEPTMRRDDEVGRHNALVVLRDGTLCIAVARCVHCECVTLAPTSDECGCGAELHPKLDQPYKLDKIQPSG